MDGFELNKIAGAVLAALLLMAGGSTLLQITMARHAPAKPGWNLPVTEPKKATAEPEKAFDVAAVLALLPKADAESGASVFRPCRTCHTSEKGGKDIVGPNLWGVVGRKVASGATFGTRYSDAMKSHGGEWSFERLAKYLHKPAEEVPGNKMVFAGVPNDADLADLLAYLRTQSDSPVALPK
ncbi:MAG: cytochrome c family protein [Hyphomicrobiaceae bacterium]